MKFSFSLLLHVFSVILLISGAGCATEMLPSEDIEVFEKHKDIISVLKSDKYRADSKEKYEAAQTLLNNVDFSYIRSVQTLDDIFSSVDAKVDRPNSMSQTLIFYYQYQNKSIRFLFFRYGDVVTRVEIIEE